MNELTGTKRKIFEAAAGLFARDGYHAVSMKQIAAEVGIKAASIYNHFVSKEEILHTIYRFFDERMEAYAPDLPALLAAAPTAPIPELMQRITIIFSREEQALIGRCMLVTDAMARFDPVANEMIARHLIDMVGDYARPLLGRLLELDRIEPIDIEAFVLILSNYCYASATRFYTSESRAISNENYTRGINMIYSMVREKK